MSWWLRTLVWIPAGIILCAGTFIGENTSVRSEAGEASVVFVPPPDGQQASGKMSRRARAALIRNARTDASSVAYDTSRATLAYIRSLPRDSSARIQQLQHVRKDAPAIEPRYRKTPSLYLKDPAAISTEAVLDSDKYVYHLRRRISTNDIRVPLEMKMEEYTALRMHGAVRKNWESLTQIYQLPGENKAGLGDIFAKITQIDIPIPKNPIFSIFGPPHINIAINGAVDIHAAFQNVKYDLFTASATGQSQSTPQFSQQVQVNVRGEIGDKLKLDADWNTQRTFDYENQLHVKYQGYDDDIVQSVEAGNVSLTTNSSFISSSSALFGIKTKLQAGPLSLTAIASQKKGQIKELSMSGGSASATFDKHPSDYSKDHYFIDTSYIPLYENIFLQHPAIVNPYKKIQAIEVWVSALNETNTSKQRNVVAYLDQQKATGPSNLSIDNRKATSGLSGSNEEMVVGSFIPLVAGTDYNYNADAGIITMLGSLQDQQAIAVAYTLNDPVKGTYDVGNFGSRTPKDDANTNLIMKLVRPQNLPNSPQMKTAWRMMLKNRYLLGVRSIKKIGFTFNINYTPSGQSAGQTVPGSDMGFLELFGLDQYNSDGTTKTPDKLIDYTGSAFADDGVTVDENRGEIIFPVLEPFSAASIKRFFSIHGMDTTKPDVRILADSLSYQSIYDTTYNGAVNDRHNLYDFTGSVTGSQSSTYSIGYNVVEGSVEVDVDGQRATLNSDYTVDYISGQVTIKNQAFLTPGKNLQIKYEANDLFQLASKTLTGARAELNIDKNTALGFTIMNMNQESLSDKVRLGEEPISNTIMGFDGSTSFNAPWLTNALNYLPGVKTLAPSQITLRGEYAYMSPNPNTRTSPIPSDQGKSVAYVDDFEGSVETIPISISFTGWKEASAPYYIKGLDSYIPSDGVTIPVDNTLIDNGTILSPLDKMSFKGHATWFNVIPTDVFTSDIWGKLKQDVVQGENQVTVLNFFFRPGERGMYNYSMNLENTVRSHPENSWGGCQLVLGTTSTNLQDQNINFIEMWVYVQQCDAARTAKLNIDLGYISEDVNANKRLDTEDGLGTGIRTGVLDPKNDVGLDSLTDVQERVVYNSFITKYPEYTGDPSGDDYRTPPTSLACTIGNARSYDGCTGSEGNSTSLAGNVPNTEDLNGNNVLDQTNSYFEYEIPLDTNNAIFKSYIIGHSPNNSATNGWVQLRIPLNNYARAIGSPSLTSVEGMRLWVGGTKDSVLFRITEFNLVGNQWSEQVKNDSTFKVSVVSAEDDPNYSTVDIGVSRPRDLTRPDQTLYGNEQSLALLLNEVPVGQDREAIKWFKTRALNMFNYHTLKMFIHGEDGTESATKQYRAFKDTDTSQHDAEVFFRFGSDSLNYYEYRAPVHPGWIGNNMEIHFADLTSLKFGDTIRAGLSKPQPVPNVPPGPKYQVSGSPTLTAITYMAIGIVNTGQQKLKGELWVDELRLLDVDNTPGWAYRLEAKAQLADVAAVSFGYSQRNPYFHGLEDHFGSYNTDINWNLSASISFEKFLPETWTGTNLAFSYSHTEGISNPLYVPGTDILVDKAISAYETSDTSSATRKKFANEAELRTSTQTLNVTDTYAVPNIHFNIPLHTWLITETINRMNFGFSYADTRQRNTTIDHSEAWNWNASFSYTLPLSQNNYIAPFSIFGDFFLFRPWKTMKLFFTPRQVAVTAALTRSQSYSKTRFISEIDTTRSFLGQRTLGFNWQFFEGGLLDFGTDYQVSVGSSLGNFETDGLGRPRSFSQILQDIFFSDRLINFGVDQNYGQTISFNTKIAAPKILSLDKIFVPNFKYSVRYGWSNNVLAGELGKSANWSGSVNFSLDVNTRTVSDMIWSAAYVRPAGTDTTKGGKPKVSLAEQLDRISRMLFKAPLFGFEKLSISFSQQNSAQNSDVVGSNGFANIFARVPFIQSSLPENGPSLLYQLGMISDPNGELVMKLKNSFPFITGYTNPGIRAQDKKGATATLTDIYSQSNNITVQTSRPLWQGAQLTLNWNVAWSYTENVSSTTDPTSAIPKFNNRQISGDESRSFFTLPPVFIFKNLKMGIGAVNDKFQQMKANDPGDSSSTEGAKLSQAFRDGFEGLPWLAKIFGDLAPRANWSFHWDGLEKFPIISNIASHASLDHAYTSSYKERWTSASTDDYIKTTQSQTIVYAFSPLIGLNLTLKEFIKGNMSATIRYGTSESYDLVPSSEQVSSSSSTNMSFSFSYGRKGIQIPFLGLSLSNDIDFSMHYSVDHSSQTLFNFNNFDPNGTPNGGSSTTTLEPSLKYTLSERVTAQAYYRFKKITPDASGSTVTGSTTNEGGVDIHVAIQ
jgi:cell surface protein SprA